MSLVNMITLPACSSSETRSDSNSAIEEIDPNIAYIQNRRAKALEHYNDASEYHIDGKEEKALEHYRRALELDDKLYAAWNNMGQLLMSQGNYADAVSAYQVAAGIELTDPRPQYNIGLAYQQVGWANDAYKYFKLALDRDDTYLPALRGLIRSAQMLDLADDDLFDSIKAAQLRETEDEWIEYFSTQYYRVKYIIDK